MRNVSITIVYDNRPYRKGLETAWGFSCLIKGAEKTILFDTGGDGPVLLANMEKLAIDPEKIDLIFLSHCHSDHVGGLPAFLQKNSKITVYLPESFPESFKNAVEHYGSKVVVIQKSCPICERVYSTGELGTWIKEQSLIIRADKGLLIIAGCAHPGMVEVVHEAQNLVQGDVLCIMGGFHLGEKSKGEIEYIISAFKKLGIRSVAPSHCSGDRASQLFNSEYQRHYIDAGVGKVIDIRSL